MALLFLGREKRQNRCYWCASTKIGPVLIDISFARTLELSRKVRQTLIQEVFLSLKTPSFYRYFVDNGIPSLGEQKRSMLTPLRSPDCISH